MGSRDRSRTLGLGAAAAGLLLLAGAGLLRQGHYARAAGRPLSGAAPYFMPLDNSPQDLGEVMAQSGAKNFIFAFVLSGGGCAPAWDGTAPVASDTRVASMIGAVRQAGGDVGVSFGGFNGTELGLACGDAASLAGAYQAVIDRYGLDYLDFDIEGGAFGDVSSETRRFQAIETLEQTAASRGRQLTVALTIPVSTVGLTFNGTDEIKAAIGTGVRIDVFNIMDFDYGGSGADQVNADVTVAEDFHQQLRTLLPGLTDAQAYAESGLTLMNGHTDQPSELFTQATFQSLEGYAAQHGLALLSFWALNRDRQCNPDTGAWVVGNCSSIAQQPYDFTKIILRFAGGGSGTPPPGPTPTPTAAPTPTAPPPPPGNLVANPGFETGGLAPWSCSSLDAVVASPTHSGSRALGAAASGSDFAQCTQAIAVLPNHGYTLAAWVQGSYAFVGVTGTGTSDPSTFAPSATAFTRLSVGFTTGPSTTSVTLFVHGWYAQGTVFADDFSVA
ncbi:MAG TPA: carbohydrate binding domain-containing protein [Candidatus Dormibacteraeota bacterium]|jgi:chitinase